MTDEHDQQSVGHIVPIGLLAAIGGALILLTLVTVWAASFDFGSANVWIALAIAVLKGSLVVLFFMHLRWDRPFNGIVFVSSLAFLALFIAFTMTDTFEYRPTIDEGNSRQVQQKLDELEP